VQVLLCKASVKQSQLHVQIVQGLLRPTAASCFEETQRQLEERAHGRVFALVLVFQLQCRLIRQERFRRAAEWDLWAQQYSLAI
jgi:hypothetical protein